MLTSQPPRYRPLVTLKKALSTWLATTLATASGVAAVHYPRSWDELKATWPSMLLPVALACFRAFSNWRKNRDEITHFPSNGGY